MDTLADYDYELPSELIASRPPERRDAARLLVVRRDTGSIESRTIRELPELMQAGDRLVLNDTRVVPARLFGIRKATEGKWEGLFLGVAPDGLWRLMARTRGKPRPGETVTLAPAGNSSSADRFELILREREPDGIWRVEPALAADPFEVLERFGTMPLPPYIDRPSDIADRERYQTTFARAPGAVAAPTAGLHFTGDLLDACRSRGVPPTWITLHVGHGTFKPISVSRLDEHAMHSEWYGISEQAAAEMNATRAQGGRLVAVGTTSARTLESATNDAGEIPPGSDWTELFIRPPYRFRAVDCLLTNFHLPRSTLLVLVSAFAGADLIRRAYATAIEQRYRFYSYGDAMLIL